jgi:hypothetical protein
VTAHLNEADDDRFRLRIAHDRATNPAGDGVGDVAYVGEHFVTELSRLGRGHDAEDVIRKGSSTCPDVVEKDQPDQDHGDDDFRGVLFE